MHVNGGRIERSRPTYKIYVGVLGPSAVTALAIADKSKELRVYILNMNYLAKCDSGGLCVEQSFLTRCFDSHCSRLLTQFLEFRRLEVDRCDLIGPGFHNSK